MQVRRAAAEINVHLRRCQDISPPPHRTFDPSPFPDTRRSLTYTLPGYG